MSSAAPNRIGEPSPLIFHLSAALGAYSQALLAAPASDSPSFPWADGLDRDASAIGGDLDRIEIAIEIAARLRATVEGIEIWQSHPYRRALLDPPALWHDGCSRLIDYGAAPEASDPAGRPILVVPSLINRPYVLDLIEDRSLLRWLAARGFRPLLLDWGTPGPGEAAFDLEAYARARLLPALEIARSLAGGPVPVLGYCMGGTIAVGLAARRPEAVSHLVAIGAPWDFRSTNGIPGGIRALLRASGSARAEALIESLGQVFGLVPVSVFQTLFAIVNPMQASLKFQRLARRDPNGATARLFVALEDWLADGVAMPAAAAREILVDWQVHNATSTGSWRFLGDTVDPREITAPTLLCVGRSDQIAPPALAAPLGEIIPGAVTLAPPTGHVGMIVGSVGRGQVWRAIADFLDAPATAIQLSH